MSNQLAAELDDLDLLSQAVEIAESLDLAGLVNDRMFQELGAIGDQKEKDTAPNWKAA